MKTFTATGGANCIGFQEACGYPAPCPIIASCGASGGGVSSDCGIADPGADISCKIIYDLLLEGMRIYQLAVTTSSQVDQNCHMGDIFAQLYD